MSCSSLLRLCEGVSTSLLRSWFMFKLFLAPSSYFDFSIETDKSIVISSIFLHAILSKTTQWNFQLAHISLSIYRADVHFINAKINLSFFFIHSPNFQGARQIIRKILILEKRIRKKCCGNLFKSQICKKNDSISHFLFFSSNPHSASQ